MKLPNLTPLQGLLTIRLVVWFAAVLIAPFVVEKLVKEKEIKGEAGYLKSLVLSLLLFIVAFLPFFLPRIFALIFGKRIFFFGFLWLIIASFLNGFITSQFTKTSYIKGLLLWGLTLILSCTAGFVISTFSIVLLRLAK